MYVSYSFLYSGLVVLLSINILVLLICSLYLVDLVVSLSNIKAYTMVP
jgi:hypothetical protein